MCLYIHRISIKGIICLFHWKTTKKDGGFSFHLQVRKVTILFMVAQLALIASLLPFMSYGNNKNRSSSLATKYFKLVLYLFIMH